MLKFATVVDEKSGLCAIGTGTDAAAYRKMGMQELDVEQGYDGAWYLAGYAPAGPAEAELLERAKAVKAGEFDTAMAANDAALMRPASDLLAAMLAPELMTDEAGDAGDGAGEGDPGSADLDASLRKFAVLRALQRENRARRARALAAVSQAEVEALAPLSLDSFGADFGERFGECFGGEAA